ncbi:MAG: hypothetical protein A3F74_18775 [Betaproteobacteria bacterium RIFCSPLOWO2_12_FULL_62_58]|nr:MAG: hypothetical protein A3F74_18775 [Betaproteobacteria bacterium RIFCSPLOWO2_12_FULL_62_58]
MPDVISATRPKLDTLRITMGGEIKTVDSQGAPRYAGIYELESPDVLTSPAFAKASPTRDGRRTYGPLRAIVTTPCTRAI